jgi:hypothetical protein
MVADTVNHGYAVHLVPGTIFHREGNSYSRGLRPKLAGIFVNRTDIIYDKKQKECDRKCYHEEMSQSVFCLNPLGWTPWTLRFYQAVMTRYICYSNIYYNVSQFQITRLLHIYTCLLGFLRLIVLRTCISQNYDTRHYTHEHPCRGGLWL